ncbi:MAG TPA: PilZ domain-containing protein [Bacteriovoracaceae bacterium]|nr:PilZ domain-containing protein [Bacteriovoracaceae bacterium]
MKSYQRRHLRAPFKETILYTDEVNFFKGRATNISEGGMLIGELPSIPSKEQITLIISLPHVEPLKNLSLLQLKTYNAEMFRADVFGVIARLVRQEELAGDVGNVFNTRFGLEFVDIKDKHRKKIENYVSNFSANLITLQTLIDLYNYDDETKKRARAFAHVLGYDQNEKISTLRALVNHDYKSLQWS